MNLSKFLGICRRSYYTEKVHTTKLAEYEAIKIITPVVIGNRLLPEKTITNKRDKCKKCLFLW